MKPIMLIVPLAMFAAACAASLSVDGYEASYVERRLLPEPDGSHAALPEGADQPEALGDDESRSELHGGTEATTTGP